MKNMRRFAAAAIASWLVAANVQAMDDGVATQLLQELQEQIEAQGTLDKAAPMPEKVQFSPSGTVVEFYNQTLKHYFRTAEAAEVTAILNGAAGPGWVRTNEDFLAWTAAGLKPANARAVCRFYAPGPNSHFYTSDPAECAQVKLDPGWRYEGVSFFAGDPPANSQCALGLIPLYRVYNNRFAFNDSNHRFTTSFATYQQMLAQGWVGEHAVMCVPNATSVNQQKTEQLIGGTWTIPYMFGTRFYTDRLAYNDLFQSSTSGEIYASGTSGHNVLTLGQYSPSLGMWTMLAPYLSTSATPADYYVVTITGNTLSGCYYFAFTASSPLGTCTPITGIRQ